MAGNLHGQASSQASIIVKSKSINLIIMYLLPCKNQLQNDIRGFSHLIKLLNSIIQGYTVEDRGTVLVILLLNQDPRCFTEHFFLCVVPLVTTLLTI